MNKTYSRVHLLNLHLHLNLVVRSFFYPAFFFSESGLGPYAQRSRQAAMEMLTRSFSDDDVDDDVGDDVDDEDDDDDYDDDEGDNSDSDSDGSKVREAAPANNSLPRAATQIHQENVYKSERRVVPGLPSVLFSSISKNLMGS